MSLTSEFLKHIVSAPSQYDSLCREMATKILSDADELERLQRWKTGDWCTLCDAPQWVNNKGEHTCAHNPGLQELTEEMLAELEETRIRRDETVAMCAQLGSEIVAHREALEVRRLREFIQEDADEDCHYRDECPSRARHGVCRRCKAKRVLALASGEPEPRKAER